MFAVSEKHEVKYMGILNSITIRNFRGFDFLKIEGLSKINLFIGKNNSGKTSILESVFLLMGMSNPLLPSSINQFRGLNINNARQLKYLFHNLKIGNKPSFEGFFSDGDERKLVIEAKYLLPSNKIGRSSLSVPEIVGLGIRFVSKKGTRNKVLENSILFENDTIDSKVSRSYDEDQYAIFVSPDKNDSATLDRYSEVIRRKSGDSLLKSLQILDNNINDIKLLTDGIYFDVKDIDELVPINIMGDGVRRFLSIATAAAEKPNDIICIDEIENGLHYSAYKLLWKSLIAFSEQNDIQLFITTHNIETLACLKELLEEEDFAPVREKAKVFTVAKTLKAGYQTYRYSFEGFKDAIDNETEIRN